MEYNKPIDDVHMWHKKIRAYYPLWTLIAEIAFHGVIYVSYIV